MPISVLGRTADDDMIPFTDEELSEYSEQEACFFGNLFEKEPKLFAGNYGNSLSLDQSTPRPCGLTVEGQSPAACPQMKRIGQCAAHCTLEPNQHFYEKCTIGNVTYKPITTRIHQEDINTCGDGVCQRAESKGNGHTPDSCSDDCGE